MRRDWEAILSAYAESGQSIKAFCMAQGLSPATFHYHYQKRRRGVSPGFIEVAPVDQVSCPVEITYPNGVILKLNGQVSYRELRQLLDV